jgi:tetratricopeptide (TPR) repeat protein
LNLRETPGSWLFEIKDRTPFDPKSMRKLVLTKSVGALVGLRDGRATYEVQAIRFDKSEFDKEKVMDWVRDNLGPSPELVQKMVDKEVVPAQVLGVSAHEQKVLALLGHDALAKGKLDRAEKMFHGLVTLNPTSNLGHTGMGKLLQARGQQDEALKAYDEALKCFPSDVDALYGKAEILLAKGQKKPALPLLFEVLYIDGSKIEPASAKAQEILDKQYSTEEIEEFVQVAGSKLLEGGKPAAGAAAGKPGPLSMGGRQTPPRA